MRGLPLLLVGWLSVGLLQGQTSNPADNPAPGPTGSTESPAPANPTAIGPAFRSACWKGDLAEVTRLLDQGAPLEGRDNQGRSGLFLACHGSPDIVKLLLARGAKIDSPAFNGDTTIGRACEYGDLGSAQLLLAAGAGADISKPNKFGHTPLMLAAREGRDPLVSLLIALHVDVNFEGKTDSALYFAVGRDHLSTVKLLLDAGARTTRPAAPPTTDRTSRPLLALAAWRDDLELIDVLLAHGADINSRGDDGKSVIGDALWGSKPETIQHLLDKGVDPNLLDDHGLTGLMYATNYKFALDVLPAFLNHGAKVDAKDNKGRTALMWAASHGNEQIVRFLLEHGADVNAADANGDTALIYAADRGNTGLVQLLKDKGATRTDIHIIAKEKPPTSLSPAQSWALAIGAIYSQLNGLNPYLLGYGNSEPSARELKEDWNITDRNSFLKVINNLLSSERRTGVQSKGAQLAAMTDAQFAAALGLLPADDAPHVKGLRTGYIKWKDRVGLAWDLCRAANLINIGYDLHYINEQEAWGFLQTIAKQTQAGFGSWQEMIDNYLDGREGWYGVREPHFDACAQLLLNPNDPNSPWNQNLWKTDLGAPAAAN